MAQKKMEMPKVAKIRSTTLEAIRKDTSRFLFVDDREGNGTCEKCGDKIHLGETRHHELRKCPSCGSTLQVRHMWRATNTDERVDWRVLATALEGNRLMLRYVLAVRVGAKLTVLSESARMVLDFNKKEEYCYESTRENEWRQTTRDFFRERGLGYNWRRYCCLAATEYEPLFFSEVKKVDVFKYVDVKDMYVQNMYASSVLGWLGKRMDLFEKLQKVGLNQLIKDDMRSYYGREIQYNPSARSLHQMLGIRHDELAKLIENPSMRLLSIMQNKDKYFGLDSVAVLNYLNTSQVGEYEYRHYLDTLNRMGSRINNTSAFPKNFREADKKVTEEYKMRGSVGVNKKIKEISDALRKMPGIQEFLEGSHGLLVYVPESTKDLYEEGKALHNCIGTYADRISEGKTLVFYIRQLSNPSAPFVAMEYCNGSVVQVRYNMNKPVEDKKIIDFTERFAAALRKEKVLVA